jgi:hypothetical protein
MIGKHVMLRDTGRILRAIRKWVNDRETVKYLSALFWFPQKRFSIFKPRHALGTQRGVFRDRRRER